MTGHSTDSLLLKFLGMLFFFFFAEVVGVISPHIDSSEVFQLIKIMMVMAAKGAELLRPS